jgi:putative endonuclease
MFFREIGKKGEILAKQFLINLGYKYLDSNFRTSFGEIDLIFKDNEILVLVEVKTKFLWSINDPELSIDDIKINRILKSAEMYINKTKIEYSEVRVDAIFVDLTAREPAIKYIKSFY